MTVYIMFLGQSPPGTGPDIPGHQPGNSCRRSDRNEIPGSRVERGPAAPQHRSGYRPHPRQRHSLR